MLQLRPSQVRGLKFSFSAKGQDHALLLLMRIDLLYVAQISEHLLPSGAGDKIFSEFICELSPL